MLAIGHENVPLMQAFAADNGSTFPIVVEESSYERYEDPGPGNYSLEIIIDRDGIVRFAEHGSSTAELITALEPLL